MNCGGWISCLSIPVKSSLPQLPTHIPFYLHTSFSSCSTQGEGNMIWKENLKKKKIMSQKLWCRQHFLNSLSRRAHNLYFLSRHLYSQKHFICCPSLPCFQRFSHATVVPGWIWDLNCGMPLFPLPEQWNCLTCTQHAQHSHSHIPYCVFFSAGGCCGSDQKTYTVGGWAWAWWLVTDIQK